MPTPEKAVHLVREQAELDGACAAIENQTELPLDTEFARTDTYRPRLCLVQVGAPKSVYCVDMLAELDPDALWRIVAAPQSVKILHAAKQDMEVFSLRFGSLPGPLFDTQIAAALLGHPPQAGYATLVEAELGVRLDKTQTRTDWSRRPLSAAQIAYAANDVAHLPELYSRLRERLAARGRDEWALEDSAALLDPGLYGVRPEAAWERLSGIGYQPVPVQARARRLAAWRERRAQHADRPRQWILADQALMTLAARNPGNLAAISALDVMPAGAVRNSGAAILAELREAEADLASGALDLSQQARPLAPDNGAVKRLASIVQAVGTNLGIAPELLATRSEMTALLRGERALRPLRGWRRELVGEPLLAALP